MIRFCAGLVGSDGETHQGIFDLSYLSTIPNMSVLAPKNKWELSDMLKFSVDFGHPIAIRYPRGKAYDGLREFRQEIIYGKSEVIYQEQEIALLAVGSMVETAAQVYELLKSMGYFCSLVNVRFVKPLDTDLLDSLLDKHDFLVTLEENVESGGFGEHVVQYFNNKDAQHMPRIQNIALPDVYVEHGSVEILKRELGVDAESIVKRIVADYVRR